MFIRKRDTMHLRNNAVVPVGFCLVLALVCFSWAQGQQGSQGQQQQTPQQVQPTPLPSDVDPSDPALPVWMKPTAPPPSAKGTPSTPGGNNASGNQTQDQDKQVKSGKGGGFTFRKDVDEVVLHATVID